MPAIACELAIYSSFEITPSFKRTRALDHESFVHEKQKRRLNSEYFGVDFCFPVPVHVLVIGDW